MKKVFYKKRFLILSEAIIISFLLFATNIITADTSDTFDITVTGEYLECNIIEDSWAVGVVSMSSSSWTNETGDTLNADIDNSTVDVDFQLQISSDAATWASCGVGGSPGADIYRLNASADSWSTQIQLITASETTLVSSTQVDQAFDLRFDAPTSTTTGQPQSITITASVIKG